jgi:hypothetical protein
MNPHNMKKIVMLAAASLLATIQLSAAPVDAVTAQATAKRYLQASARRGHAAPAAIDVKLVLTEKNQVNTNQAAYYIFNTSDSYVIVSGDDRAREVLAHGDRPLDINNIPCNMQLWLEGYRKQIEFLQAHPDYVVDNGTPNRTPITGESVDPLLSAMWDQGEPYNRECPMSGTSLAVTGCGATSLAMIFHYWKFPTEPTPSVPGYTTQSESITLETLPPTTFDWDNMLDRYRGGYNDTQASAVAHLMRYIGQSERMDYSSSSSGTGSYDIWQTIRRFGYDPDAMLLSKDSWWGDENYDDEEWGMLIQEELLSHRPVLMCAYTPTWSGHAFNIDGYDASDDTYHINWGWSGTGNANYALNAFRGGGEVFNINQQIFIGIEPPATVPTIKARASRLRTTAYVDSAATAEFTVKGTLLTSDVTLTLNDENGVFAINTDHVSQQNLKNGMRVTVTYQSSAVGTHHATITLSSEGAEDKVVTLIGQCILETHEPVMLAASDIDASSFIINWEDITPSHNVVNYNLEVARVPFYELRLNETFDATEYSGTSTTDCSSQLDEFTTNPGWTGSKVYRSNSDVLLGTSKSKGWLQTPALDMYGNDGHVTVKVSAKSSGSDTSSPLKISCGDADTLIYVNNEDGEYCVMLPCPANNTPMVKLSTAVGKRVVISSFQAYAGDDYTPIDLSKATYIEGITGNAYQISDLQPGCYAMRVQTLYTDGALSPWSNRMRAMIAWKRGDVNHDNEITVADINMVINNIINGANSPSVLAVSDVNGDGEITVSDVNMIIDRILGY